MKIYTVLATVCYIIFAEWVPFESCRVWSTDYIPEIGVIYHVYCVNQIESQVKYLHYVVANEEFKSV